MSSAITSLRRLQEPAYMRLGTAIDDELSAYLAKLRSRTQMLAELTRQGRPSEVLGQLLRSGGILELPALDEAATRVRLGALRIQTPEHYQTPICVDYGVVLMRVPTRPDRAVGVSTTTAKILAAARDLALAEAVTAVARLQGVPDADLWPALLHDLTGALVEGVATLECPTQPQTPFLLAQESS